MSVVITRQETLEGRGVTRAWSEDGGGESGWMRGWTLGCALASQYISSFPFAVVLALSLLARRPCQRVSLGTVRTTT